MKHHFKKAFAYYKKHERTLMPATLVVGFIIDVVTFRTIQLQCALLVLFVHIFVVIAAIAYINISDQKIYPKRKIGQFFDLITPFFLQLSLGALLSAAFIFYTFSSALSASWPLLLVLVFVMVSNERNASAYRRPNVQFPALYFALFLVLSVGIPFVFRSIHPAWFFLSGVLSFFIVWGFIKQLGKYATNIVRKEKGLLIRMGTIFIIMIGLYFGNIIPPVPLSVYHSGVYHLVQRVGNNYEVQKEKRSFFDRFSVYEKIHLNKGPVYVFTSVVAPGELKTNIVHHWQKWNADTDEWISSGKITYPILGGRKEGYRGFSFSAHAEEGKWRVQVETVHGQILGRETFVVVRDEKEIEIERIIIE